MRAVVHDRYGPPDVLRVEDVPTPTPTADRVLPEALRYVGEGRARGKVVVAID